MAQDTWLILILILVGLAVLMQAAAMLGIWLTIRKFPEQIEGIRADVKQRLDPLTQSVTEIVANSRDPLRAITTNLAEISELLQTRSKDVDAMVATLMEKSRVQIERLDQMVTGVVEKVESTATTVQRQVLVPVQELSAVIHGIRSGLEFLFSRRRTPSVTEATQDEQLFI
jgi:hypothetical protein